MPTKKSKTKATQEESKSSVFNYLKFGESYTSLILGIVVVIIATVLLLSFVHNKNVNKANVANQEIANALLTVQPSPTVAVSLTPTAVATPTVTLTPTSKPTAKVTAKPTEKKVTPTAVAMAKKTTPTPVVKQKQEIAPKGSTYTIVTGDTLWSIAEKVYNDGYKWPEIARVNNLSDPGLIHVGNKLKLPTIDQKNTTVKKGDETKTSQKVEVSKPTVVQTEKISGNTYKLVTGDSLWTISVRAYGDGYKWPEIAKANNLSHPSLVHVGNTIKIPRGK